jgi:formamidopyrimidine-DNA glycosylase
VVAGIYASATATSMPELPEVETAARGLRPHLLGATIDEVIVRERRLRWPVPVDLAERLQGAQIESVARRGKYILIAVSGGTLLLHLGMSGSVRILLADSEPRPPGPHDHVEIRLASGATLRLNDPRRFGCLLWTAAAPARHPLLRDLGVEPLEAEFTPGYLYARSRGRRVALKSFLMDAHVVVGVGNIYASESLFRAGIHPLRAAGRVSLARYGGLVAAVRAILLHAIARGGTTLRDFTDQEGQPGYFARELAVYGRAGLPCVRCSAPLRMVRIGQRSSFWCVRCQR